MSERGDCMIRSVTTRHRGGMDEVPKLCGFHYYTTRLKPESEKETRWRGLCYIHARSAATDEATLALIRLVACVASWRPSR